MSSTCTIRDRGGEDVTDPETGEVTAGVGATVYSGACRVRPASGPGGDSSTPDAGGQRLFSFDYLVSVPFSVTGVLEGHRLTIDTSPDASLAGVEVQVEHVDRGEHITARRLQCREVA